MSIVNENSNDPMDRDPPWNQLERIQRMRKGQAVPAPISVNVSAS